MNDLAPDPRPNAIFDLATDASIASDTGAMTRPIRHFRNKHQSAPHWGSAHSGARSSDSSGTSISSAAPSVDRPVRCFFFLFPVAIDATKLTFRSRTSPFPQKGCYHLAEEEPSNGTDFDRLAPFPDGKAIFGRPRSMTSAVSAVAYVMCVL